MKRLSCTEKWNDNWFSELSPKMKLAWLYVLDRCDMAGIFELSSRIISFNVGDTITDEEFLLTFCDRIEKVENSSNKYFIRNFIKFQYGNLRQTNKVHCSVMNKMIEHGLKPSLYPTAKGKEKDQMLVSDSFGQDDSGSQKETKPLAPHVEALVEVCHLERESMGSNEYSCAANIKRMALAKYPSEQAIAGQIRIRAQRYRSKYPGINLTVNALVKHWPALSDESLEKQVKH